MNRSTPGPPVHHQLPEFTETHVHRVNGAPVAYWAPTDLGSFSFSILSFCLFILFMGFSRQEYCSGLPFASPVDHILSDLSTMTRPSSISALLTMPKPLTVWITINCGKFFKRWDYHHLTCLLRNLYAGQEAVRTGHGTTDWFQIGKGVHQGCILSPCIFNLYSEYIM